MIGKTLPVRPDRETQESGLRRMLAALGPAEGWRIQGNCSDADWTLFEPVTNGDRSRPYPTRAAEAARYCVGCPVADRCEAAADAGQEQGVWNGTWRVGDYDRYRVIPITLAPPRRRSAA